MICLAPNCDREARSKGLCVKHYKRVLRHGSLSGGAPERGKARSFLLEAAIFEGDECLIWPFARMKSNGYAICNYEGRSQITSRVVCRLAHGEPPSKRHEAAHSCGQGHQGCINPKHLRWALPVENCADTVRHGRSLRGTNNKSAKLNPSAVDEIRTRLADHVPQRQIAAEFNISQTTVSGISIGALWGWLS